MYLLQCRRKEREFGVGNPPFDDEKGVSLRPLCVKHARLCSEFGGLKINIMVLACTRHPPTPDMTQDPFMSDYFLEREVEDARSKTMSFDFDVPS